MVKFKIRSATRALNLICCWVTEASDDCVSCLWLTSDFSHGCDGQFPGAATSLGPREPWPINRHTGCAD